MTARVLWRQKLLGKVDALDVLHFINNYQNFTSHPSLTTSIICNILYVFPDADKKPADNLTNLAAIDVDDLLSKTRGISKGVIFNVWQSLLKEWGPDSLGVLPEDTMQELLTGLTFQNYHHFISSIFVPNSSTLILTYHLFFTHFLSFPGFKFVRTCCSY